MPITPFIHRQTFDPETTDAMSRAFQNACRALGLADRDDPLNEVVAKHVIKLAETGVRNSDALYMLTVTEFKNTIIEAASAQ
jgi:hypothetical protein